jgi:MFS family permease
MNGTTAIDMRVAPRQRSTGLVLALLFVAYTFNYLDRQILGILAAPIKADLHLTDTQFGAVGGLAFALLYSVLAIPFALIADKTSRSAVIAVALAVWSGFTALCGFAQGYGQLFLYRLGVGIGEAGGVAPSYALIADYYPPERRARALSIFFLGIPVGLAGGMMVGAYLAHAINWRAAFIVMGAAGVILAPILRFVVRDVPRRTSVAATAPLASVFPILARKPAFWLLAFGASASSLCGYGLALWTPSVLMRSFRLDLLSTANFLASQMLIGGLCRRLRGRLVGRSSRWDGPRLVCEASGDRLARYRSDVRGRLSRAQSVDRVAAAADRRGAEHPVARPDFDRRPAPCAPRHARHRLG